LGILNNNSMRVKISIFIFFIISCIELSAQSYTAIYDTSQFLNEKVIVFTNKEVYLSGEDIEFSITTYDAIYNRLINLSSIAYVELLDQDGVAVQKTKVFISNGVAIGKFQLSKNIITDYYFLKVYTQYMRNFSCNNFNYKRIGVVNVFKYLSSSDLQVDSDFAFSIR